jgi:hypothetical protein
MVSGRFNPVCYGVAAFICYSDVCVTEYISDLAYLWGYVRVCCPFLVFSVTWCGVFCFMFYLMSEFIYYCGWETVLLGDVKDC